VIKAHLHGLPIYFGPFARGLYGISRLSWLPELACAPTEEPASFFRNIKRFSGVGLFWATILALHLNRGSSHLIAIKTLESHLRLPELLQDRHIQEHRIGDSPMTNSGKSLVA
jgi:hypothetical protein